VHSADDINVDEKWERGLLWNKQTKVIVSQTKVELISCCMKCHDTVDLQK